MTLRARLLLLVATVVAAVLTTSTYFEVRSFERVLEGELMATAERAASAVVVDLKSRGAAVDAADVRDTLNELIEANPALRSLSIFEIIAGNVEIVSSTSSEERAEALELAREAMSSSSERMDVDDRRVVVAVPLLRDNRSIAAVASVSLGALEQARTRGRTVAMWFAVPTVLLVTLLIDVAARRVVHQPIS